MRSRLGRSSPRPGEARLALMSGSAADETGERRSRQAAREWGRFTRNFVVQASAADWALTLLATLRRQLAERVPSAQIVFFLHDELMVHCPTEVADQVAAEFTSAAAEASALVFGDTPVRFPLEAAVVTCYAAAK